MVIVLKEKTTKDQKDQLVKWFEGQGLKVHQSEGEYKTILGLVGDVASVDKDMIEMLDIVDRVTSISEPYKNANRKFHPKDTVITVSAGPGTPGADANAVSGVSTEDSHNGDSEGCAADAARIGGGNFAVIAGPSSVESEDQIIEIARSIKTSGASFLCGGAFRPRKSPYMPQGTREEGLKFLAKAKQETGLPVVSELLGIEHLKDFDDVDVIQVGARNMQNYEMLKELGCLNKPVLLKRGLANTLEELLMSAEYIMAGGNQNVILCECGIRTFEQYTKDTLDISAVPALKKRTHLPVVVAPNQGTGYSDLVEPMALAAVAAGADGLLIEVHSDPAHAVSDGAQSITPDEFARIMEKVSRIRAALQQE